MAENVKESCLVLPRCTSLHLYYKETLRDKWGVFSHVIVNAEFDSGLKIKILSIFDPQNPLFGSKNGPIQIIFLSTQWYACGTCF